MSATSGCDDVDVEGEGEDRAALRTYIGVMVGFKIVMAIVLLHFTHALGAIALLLALHIPWVIAAAFLLSAPSVAYYRLLKVRARRAELIRQEFNVDASCGGFELRR